MSGPTINTIFALPNMRPFMDCPRLLLSIEDNRMAEGAGYSSLFPKGLPEVEKDGLNSGQMERQMKKYQNPSFVIFPYLSFLFPGVQKNGTHDRACQ